MIVSCHSFIMWSFRKLQINKTVAILFLYVVYCYGLLNDSKKNYSPPNTHFTAQTQTSPTPKPQITQKEPQESKPTLSLNLDGC